MIDAVERRAEVIFNWIIEFGRKNERDPKIREIDEAFNFTQGFYYRRQLERKERWDMMEEEKKKTGGLIFSQRHRDEGLTIRDWFAGQALVGIVAKFGDIEDGLRDSDIVKTAYEIADAMLKEREK